MSVRYANKKQHFVPLSYLRAWCDPACPPGHTPYVWLSDANGSATRKKAPEKIFAETDMYTFRMPDGSRDLYAERGLSTVETRFSLLRKFRLDKRTDLDPEDWQWLCLFVALSQVRTKASRDHFAAQLHGLRDRVRQLEEQVAKDAREGVRRDHSRTLQMEGGSPISSEEVQNMADTVLTTMLLPMAEKTIWPIMLRMSAVMLCTDDELGFVTTDHPCTWFDPLWYRMPPIYRSVGIANKNIEITMPISPSQCILFTHEPRKFCYLDVPYELVEILNNRHCSQAPENIVARRSEVRDAWFTLSELPPDAWENQHRDGQA